MNKAAEKSSSTMDSKENMLAELNSLYEKFEQRITERSSQNRNSSRPTDPDKTEVENFNRLKLHRTKVKGMHNQLIDARDQEWLNIRDKARKLVEEAKAILSDPQPSTENQ